jgi:hypothetical protein
MRTVDVLHDDQMFSLCLDDVVHLNDIGVHQLRVLASLFEQR